MYKCDQLKTCLTSVDFEIYTLLMVHIIVSYKQSYINCQQPLIICSNCCNDIAKLTLLQCFPSPQSMQAAMTLLYYKMYNIKATIPIVVH